MLKEPLSAEKAKSMARDILENGVITYSKPHAYERMQKHKLEPIDCVNVLRGGIYRNEDIEWENGSWRYKARTMKIVVVFQFLSEDELLIVTTWRLK